MDRAEQCCVPQTFQPLFFQFGLLRSDNLRCKVEYRQAAIAATSVLPPCVAEGGDQLVL